MILFMTINEVYMAKYSMRITAWWPTVVILYLLLQYVVFRLILPVFDMSSRKVWTNVVKIGAITGMLLMLAAQLRVDPYTVKVDRWSALHFPVQYLLNGDYPYSAPTHLGGRASPFPVWQLFHIPFYLCNNVGLSLFATLGIFFWAINKVISHSAAWKALVLVSMSISFYYEASVRSDILANFLLLASSVLLITPYLSQKWVSKYYIPLSIITGLFASTRVLTILPIAILFLPYYIKLKPNKMIFIPLIILAVFISTFVPIVMLDPHEFFYGINSPWRLQTRQGNSIDFLIFIPLIIWFAFIWRKSYVKYCLMTSIYLILFVTITITHNMIRSGNFNLYDPMYDITYFVPAMPFIIIGFVLIHNTCLSSPHRNLESNE